MCESPYYKPLTLYVDIPTIAMDRDMNNSNGQRHEQLIVPLESLFHGEPSNFNNGYSIPHNN